MNYEGVFVFMKRALKLFLLFQLIFFTQSVQADDSYLNKLPPNLVLGQELKWEKFQLKILTNQKSTSLVFPLDIYIVAYDTNLSMSFTGTVGLSIESLAARTYRETALSDKDQIAPGIYKITYPFEQTGDYKIKANFVALNGAFIQLETAVQVKPSESMMNYQKNSFMIIVIVGIVFGVIYYVRKKFLKK